MTQYGNILATHRYNVLGPESIEYEWQGGPLALLDDQWAPNPVKTGDRFTIGPWRLRMVDYDYAYLAIVVTRDGWQAWREIAYRAVGRRLDRLYGRLIITAAVWGMASWRQGQMPSWRQVDWRACLTWPFGRIAKKRL